MLIGKLPSAIGTGLTYWDGRTSRLRKGGKGKKKKHQTPIPSVIIYTTFSRSIIYIHTHIPPSLHRARYQRIYPKKKSKSSNRRRERARSLCLIPRDIPRSLALLRSYYCLLDTYTNSYFVPLTRNLLSLPNQQTFSRILEKFSGCFFISKFYFFASHTSQKIIPRIYGLCMYSVSKLGLDSILSLLVRGGGSRGEWERGRTQSDTFVEI
ncbi:hypothetical protein GGS26DRAFT_351604 [Hypomontagnella submonticulosa]|nr:hypothetical protein GGS26DRAFT_351604 [Hypomontagnella submonticulosa]